MDSVNLRRRQVECWPFICSAPLRAHRRKGLVMTSVTSSTSRVITDSPVVVALDYNKRDAALAFVDGIDPRDCRLKVGKEMFTLFGPQIVRDLQQRGFDVFLDLKFHDIPNTTRTPLPPPQSWVYGWSTSMRRAGRE